MATIHKRTYRDGSEVWVLMHGTPPNRDRFVAGTTREEAEATPRLYKWQLALHGSAPESITIADAVGRYNEHLKLNRSKSTKRRYGRVLQTFAGCFIPQFHGELELLRDVKPLHLDDSCRRDDQRIPRRVRASGSASRGT